MRLNQSNDSNENKRIEWFSIWFIDVSDGNLGDCIDSVANIEITYEVLIPS